MDYITRYTFTLAGVGWIIGFLAIAARSLFWGNDYYYFLDWNLFLAWIPAVLAILVHRLDHSKIHHKIATPFFFFLWLVFYPNAPYIITDFKHLTTRAPVPLLYDFGLILAYSIIGVILGYISLYLIHHTINRYIKDKALLWLLICAHFPLIAFGVYVGRYLRWNSWDVFTKPEIILSELFGTVTNSKLYTPNMFAYIAIFSVLYLIGYYCFYRIFDRIVLKYHHVKR